LKLIKKLRRKNKKRTNLSQSVQQPSQRQKSVKKKRERLVKDKNK